MLYAVTSAHAGQAPFAAAAPDIPISARDRVYAAEQFSNTVSVVDPSTNRLLGVIRLGEPQPTNFSPLYRGQVLVHGVGFAPDGRTIAVVSIGSNSVTFIDTATNAVKHTTYIGRSPHEAFFTPDGREVWVTVRGEDYVSVLDAKTYEETARVKTPGGPGMTIFSPDGHFAYVCSSFNPQLVVFDIASRAEVGRVTQLSPFCPNLAATPDGKQLWYTLKDTGKTVVIDAKPPFATLKVLDTGPITNQVNFVDTARSHLAYVTVGGLNQVQVFRRDTFAKVATIAVGKLPHGIWPSGDGTRVYVGLENDDALVAIDTASNKVIASIPIGQAAQAVNYVANAVPSGDGTSGLQPLGIAGGVTHITLGVRGASGPAPTSVSLFDQGLVQILEAAVTGLSPTAPYVLGLATTADGGGDIEPLASFKTNSSGAAIVNATGPIRALVQPGTPIQQRYLVITPGIPGQSGTPVQVQQN
ncbi:beta-propeller fold lactonase family protein [Sphingosinicellaceae bacterium]|nr:beta-propeller fold lactonase family protein [Sphingosinicellaceae bacterium]